MLAPTSDPMPPAYLRAAHPFDGLRGGERRAIGKRRRRRAFGRRRRKECLRQVEEKGGCVYLYILGYFCT